MTRITWFIVGLALSSTLAVVSADIFDFKPIVPAVVDNRDIYLSDSIGEHNSYLKVITLIEKAPAGTTITLHLMGYGGQADSTIHLANAIALSKAVINIQVEGPVYSSHALLAMASKNIKIADESLFMFHVFATPMKTPSGETTVKDIRIVCESAKGETDRGQSAYDKCINGEEAINVIYERMYVKYIYKYMTKQEIEDFKSGHDIYIDGIEMQRRIKNGFRWNGCTG